MKPPVSSNAGLCTAGLNMHYGNRQVLCDVALPPLAVVSDKCDAVGSAKVFSQLMLVMGLAPILAPMLVDSAWGFYVLRFLLGVAEAGFFPGILFLPSPGMPGQPMHYVVPAKASHKELAEKFIALATSPEVQADGIVKKFNWYPGIDAQFVKPKLDEATWNKLFVDITPDDLASKGKPFPIAPYNSAILEAYEQSVK